MLPPDGKEGVGVRVKLFQVVRDMHQRHHGEHHPLVPFGEVGQKFLGAASQGKMVRRVRRKAPTRCGLGEKSEMASSETYLSAFPSERQIEQRRADSNAFRWYPGIDLDERVPDHSTISQLRRRKPGFRKVFRRLFEEVVRQCVEKGLVSGKLMATDPHLCESERVPRFRASGRGAGGAWGLLERLDTYEEEGLAELERQTGKR